jgi:hypothetical protein
MEYCRNLEFTQDPDYDYLRRLFKELYVSCGFENEYIFDWTIQRYHAQMNQESFGVELGLRAPKHGGSSEGNGSEDHSASGEKLSLENKFHMSHEGEIIDHQALADMELVN